MIKLVGAILNISLSLVVGALTLALCAYYFPDQLEVIQIQASHFKDWFLETITRVGSNSSINVWVRFLLADEQLVFMFFVILARIFLYFFFALFAGLFKSKEYL